MNQVSHPPYPKESAGGVMAERHSVPVVLLGATLSEVRDMLSKKGREYRTVNYIYVIDGESRLRGIFSIKEFFIHQHDKERVDDIMQRNLITIHPYAHQERAALLALKHNLISLPIVDKNGIFLGAISADTMFKILDKEAVEDVLRLHGMYFSGSYDDLLRLSVAKSITHRIPWLFLGLAGGFLVSGIVGQFESILSQNLILAAFIPLVVYMADAIGTQMETFIIRDFATHPNFSFVRYFLKQISIVGAIGLIMGGTVSLVSFLLHKDILLSVVLGIALLFAVLSSVLTGLVIPYLFRKLNFDPANASGPIATIIQDILSVLVYFLTASLIL